MGSDSVAEQLQSQELKKQDEEFGENLNSDFAEEWCEDKYDRTNPSWDCKLDLNSRGRSLEIDTEVHLRNDIRVWVHCGYRTADGPTIVSEVFRVCENWKTIHSKFDDFLVEMRLQLVAAFVDIVGEVSEVSVVAEGLQGERNDGRNVSSVGCF